MEDELSLQDIVLRLWARRGVIALIVLLAALGAGAWLLFELDFSSRDIVYHIDLKGIEKGQYPSGAAFSPNDLQSPEVLRASLEACGIAADSLDEITDSLLIEHGSPETPGIVKKHRERLASDKLTAAEIDDRNKEFKEELALATGSSLRLMLNPSVAGLGTVSAIRLLQEIPAQWTRIYSERYRIYSVGLDDAAVTQEIEALGEPASVIAAIRALNAIARGLREITNDNRVSHLVGQSGQTADELLERLHVFRSTQFGPTSLAVLSKSDPVTDSYRMDMRFQVQYLRDQIEGYNQIAEDVFRGRDGAASEWAETTDSSAVNQLQLSGDSLSTIIDLTERASGAEFLREVMMDRHRLTTELAQVKVELARLEATSRYEPSAATLEGVERKFNALRQDYEDLYVVALEKLRAELGTLYSAAATPLRMRELDLGRSLMRLAGAVLVALLIGVLVAFLMPEPRHLR